MALPPRPQGAIIWARCNNADQLMSVETLGRKLAVQGDPVSVIATLRNWQPDLADRALPEPQGKANIRAFIAHWRPAMAVWISGGLDPTLLAEMRGAGIACILVDASTEGLATVAGRWVPGALRILLSEFEAILALDETTADRLIRAGAPAGNVLITGAMEDCAPTLPCNDIERSALARAIGTRTVWLAAAAHLDEAPDLCLAQQEASKRAHRLLLIVVPRNPAEGAGFADIMRNRGFHVSLRSVDPDPPEVAQIYVVDTDEDLGLWYRIAPICYLGGSLKGGGCRDPFEATALGSAVIYGPQIAPFERHAARLNAANASRLIRSGGDLGPVVESLLATDKTAELAHAAWDVTSRGATVTNRIAALIQLRLDELVT